MPLISDCFSQGHMYKIHITTQGLLTVFECMDGVTKRLKEWVLHGCGC